MLGPTEPGFELELGQLGTAQDYLWDQWEDPVYVRLWTVGLS